MRKGRRGNSRWAPFHLTCHPDSNSPPIPGGQAAVIARRLAAIAKDVDIPGQEGTRREIEKYCEHFETSLLDEFSGAYEAGDLEHMSVCLPPPCLPLVRSPLTRRTTR
jgi:hypothetical protein